MLKLGKQKYVLLPSVGTMYLISCRRAGNNSPLPFNRPVPKTSNECCPLHSVCWTWLEQVRERSLLEMGPEAPSAPHPPPFHSTCPAPHSCLCWGTMQQQQLCFPLSLPSFHLLQAHWSSKYLPGALLHLLLKYQTWKTERAPGQRCYLGCAAAAECTCITNLK